MVYDVFFVLPKKQEDAAKKSLKVVVTIQCCVRIKFKIAENL